MQSIPYHSPKLNEVMKELEEKRERFDAFFDENCVDNPLKISKTYDTVSNIFREKEKKGKLTSSSAAEEEGETAAEAAVFCLKNMPGIHSERRAGNPSVIHPQPEPPLRR